MRVVVCSEIPVKALILIPGVGVGVTFPQHRTSGIRGSSLPSLWAAAHCGDGLPEPSWLPGHSQTILHSVFLLRGEFSCFTWLFTLKKTIKKKQCNNEVLKSCAKKKKRVIDVSTCIIKVTISLRFSLQFVTPNLANKNSR